MRRIGIWLAVVAVASPAPGRDIFVNNVGGSDTLDGGSHMVETGNHGPVRTLRKAMLIADPGDVIRIIPGAEPIREEIAISGGRQRGGTARYPIVIEGNGAVIDGAAPIEVEQFDRLAPQTYRLIGEEGPIHTGGHLFVDGARANRGRLGSLAANEFAISSGRYVFKTEPKKSIEDYSFAAGRRTAGLVLYRTNYWIIRGLTFRNFAGDGAQVRGPAEGIAFEHCRFENNGRAGLAVQVNSKAEVRDCYVEHNVRAGVLGKAISSVTLERVKITGSAESVALDETRVREIPGDPRPAPPPRLPALPERLPTGVEPKRAARAATPPTDAEPPAAKPPVRSTKPKTPDDDL
ncbi:MAG TPA: right-handed parallel beta-helix repeat-containing protein [Planctomycetia bacterium]|nr:right-handed parallel beta-helix repeat-containing protein [Planctomycetia bacterium]